MRIKPKNPKYLKIRRYVIGGVALAGVLAVLLAPRDSAQLDDEAVALPDTAVTSLTPEDQIPGEINWEYPPDWVDYSDLPDKELLGDDSVRGLSNWRYLLVNGLDQTNYLRPSYYPEMTAIESGYFFQTRAADDLRAFLAGARAAGFSVRISRTYLSYADQKTRFNGMASTIYDRGEMSLEEAEKQVIAMGYYPGADEHQTGLAVNFTDENGEAKFSTPVLEWMREHCGEYGFILRYPEGSDSITGRSADSAHYRYVGLPAAEQIHGLNITLEEYMGMFYTQEAEIIYE